jgi:hypothetical protein
VKRSKGWLNPRRALRPARPNRDLAVDTPDAQHYETASRGGAQHLNPTGRHEARQMPRVGMVAALEEGLRHIAAKKRQPAGFGGAPPR